MGKVMVGSIRCVLVLVLALFHPFSVFGQADFYSNFTTDKSVNGTYSVEMVRHYKIFGTAKTITQHFRIVQEITDTSVMNDRALATYQFDDTVVLIGLQNKSFVYYLVRDDYYDSFYFDESNLHNFFRFAVINLRYLHNKGSQKDFPFSASTDTTYEKMDGSEEICTTIVSVQLDTFGTTFTGQITVSDIVLNDTQLVNIVFKGSRISTDSFEMLFRESSLFVQENVKNRSKVDPEPGIPKTIDTPHKPVYLDSALYDRLEASNISGKNISITSGGKFKVYYFYFNGCIPCKLAKPYIQKLQQDTRFEVVVLNGEDKDSSKIMYRLERDSIEGVPVIIADKSLLKSFNVSVFPVVILFDENGKEIDRCEGFIEDWYRELLYK